MERTADQPPGAGASCMTFTPEEAKQKLCSYCYQMYEIVNAGGIMSTGDTDNGDMMVFSSTDPAVQEKIDGLQKACEAMAAMSQ